MSETTQGRMPPYSDDGERGVIGAVLHDSCLVLPVMVNQGVTADEFYVPAHRMLVETMLEMFAAGWPVDVLTVSDKLKEKGIAEKVGGMSYLSRIMDACAAVDHAGYYLELVRKTAIRRRIISKVREIEQAAYDTEEGEQLLMTVPSQFAELAMKTTKDDENATLMASSREKWKEATLHKGRSGNLTWPWKAVQDLTLGPEVGLTIIGGRPSAGKTMFEDEMACHTASQGMAVGRATLDSEPGELLERAIARKARVSLPKLKRGWAGQSDFAKVDVAIKTLETYKMYVSNRHRDVRSICSWARALKMRHDIKLFTIDYIQQVQAPELEWAAHDDVKRVGYAAEMFKALSFELGIPVMVLAQMSRQGKDDPTMSSLGRSGTLEEAAHKIILLYRDDEKAKAMDTTIHCRATTKKRPIIFKVAKDKSGEMDIEFEMWMRPHYFFFEKARTGFADDALDADEMDLLKQGEKAIAEKQGPRSVDGVDASLEDENEL